MTIFITGGTGFIGQHFINDLVAKHGPQSRIYLLARGAGNLEGVTRLAGSLSDLSKYRAELLDSDYVFHIAAKATYGKGAGYQETNADATATIVKILEDSPKLKNFIFLSTIGAVDRQALDFCSRPLGVATKPNPRSVYGKSKLAAEKIVRASKIPHTIVRPTWVYGKGMRAASHIHQFVSMAAKEKRLVFHLDFPGRVSLIHVSDLSRALLNAVDNRAIIGKTYYAETESLPLGELLGEVWSQVHGERISRSGFPRLFRWLRFFHFALPLSIANLFADYLFARDDDFRRDFTLGAHVPFSKGVADVAADNVELTGRIIITGANSGIGLALARRLAERGKKLLLVDRDREAMSAIPGATALQVDLSDPSGIDRVVEAASGRILALINNAGVGYKGGISDLTAEKIETTFKVNVLAPMLLTKKLARELKRDHTTIVNTGSSVAYSPLPGMSIYAASKAAAVSWSEALAYEWRETNPVLTFSPSGTATGFQKAGGVSTEHGKLMNPDDVAIVIARRLDGRGGHTVMGLKSKVLILVSRVLPIRKATKIWGGLFASLR